MRREGLELKGKSACELVSRCPYHQGLFDMPEEYRQRCCRCEFQLCGRYLTYVAVERERQIRFGGKRQKDEA